MSDRLLISHDDLLAFLKQKDNTGYDDDQLKVLNAYISGAVEERIKATVLATEFIEDYEGTGDAEMILYNYPIIEVTEVVDDIGNSFVSGTDFRIIPRSGILKLTGGSWCHNTYYTITYKAGYELEDIPKSIKMAVCLWAGELFNKLDSKTLGVISNVKFGQEVISYINDGPSEAVDKLLKGFKRSMVVTTRS